MGSRGGAGAIVVAQYYHDIAAAARVAASDGARATVFRRGDMRI
jgi:hypothetical protein